MTLSMDNWLWGRVVRSIFWGIFDWLMHQLVSSLRWFYLNFKFRLNIFIQGMCRCMAGNLIKIYNSSGLKNVLLWYDNITRYWFFSHTHTDRQRPWYWNYEWKVFLCRSSSRIDKTWKKYKRIWIIIIIIFIATIKTLLMSFYMSSSCFLCAIMLQEIVMLCCCWLN